jgi:hypothetical protein
MSLRNVGKLSPDYMFLATDPDVPGSFSGASRFSEKQRVWNNQLLPSTLEICLNYQASEIK